MEANTWFVLAVVVNLCGLVKSHGLGDFQKILTGLEKPADTNPLSFLQPKNILPSLTKLPQKQTETDKNPLSVLLPHNIFPNLETTSKEPEKDKNPFSFLLPQNILPNPTKSTSKQPEEDKNPLSVLLPHNMLPDLTKSPSKQPDTDKNPLSSLLPHDILPNLTKLLPKQPETGTNPLSSLLENGLPDLGAILPKQHKTELDPFSLLQPNNILKLPFNLHDKVMWLQEALTRFFALINALITESLLDSINLPDLISFYEFVLRNLCKIVGPILQIPIKILNNKL
ncbi:hypothetical protein WA026_020475 [Henosepilachna vigintioctopunctata]|uniref:Uncharacterized protein n=1 Tax=Henosepilachna vigintioctopunctata TaxID=420089 RepID=A0AAW1VEW1_9CUCU